MTWPEFWEFRWNRTLGRSVLARLAASLLSASAVLVSLLVGPVRTCRCQVGSLISLTRTGAVVGLACPGAALPQPPARRRWPPVSQPPVRRRRRPALPPKFLHTGRRPPPNFLRLGCAPAPPPKLLRAGRRPPPVSCAPSTCSRTVSKHSPASNDHEPAVSGASVWALQVLFAEQAVVAAGTLAVVPPADDDTLGVDCTRRPTSRLPASRSRTAQRGSTPKQGNILTQIWRRSRSVFVPVVTAREAGRGGFWGGCVTKTGTSSQRWRRGGARGAVRGNFLVGEN